MLVAVAEVVVVAAGVRAALVWDKCLGRVRVDVGVVVPTDRVLPSHAGRPELVPVAADFADA